MDKTITNNADDDLESTIQTEDNVEDNVEDDVEKLDTETAVSLVYNFF